jgi:hypothetical protein
MRRLMGIRMWMQIFDGKNYFDWGYVWHVGINPITKDTLIAPFTAINNYQMH